MAKRHPFITMHTSFHPQRPIGSFLNGVVVFPDGTVHWEPELTQDSDDVSLKDSDLESTVPTPSSISPPRRYTVHYHHHVPESFSLKKMLETSLSMAIALIVIFLLGSMLPPWSRSGASTNPSQLCPPPSP